MQDAGRAGGVLGERELDEAEAPREAVGALDDGGALDGADPAAELLEVGGGGAEGEVADEDPGGGSRWWIVWMEVDGSVCDVMLAGSACVCVCVCGIIGGGVGWDWIGEGTYSVEPSATAAVDGMVAAILCSRRRRGPLPVMGFAWVWTGSGVVR